MLGGDELTEFLGGEGSGLFLRRAIHTPCRAEGSADGRMAGAPLQPPHAMLIANGSQATVESRAAETWCQTVQPGRNDGRSGRKWGRVVFVAPVTEGLPIMSIGSQGFGCIGCGPGTVFCGVQGTLQSRGGRFGETLCGICRDCHAGDLPSEISNKSAVRQQLKQP